MLRRRNLRTNKLSVTGLWKSLTPDQTRFQFWVASPEAGLMGTGCFFLHRGSTLAAFPRSDSEFGHKSQSFSRCPNRLTVASCQSTQTFPKRNFTLTFCLRTLKNGSGPVGFGQKKKKKNIRSPSNWTREDVQQTAASMRRCDRGVCAEITHKVPPCCTGKAPD